MQTLQGAWWETLFGTLPSRKRFAPGHSLVADHDQIGADLLGDVEDRVGGIALPRMRLDVDPLLLGKPGGGLEGDVHVLARTQRIGHVAGHLALLLADATAGDRLEGRHHAQLRAGELRQPDRLANSLARRLGAVGANHDALEQAVSLRLVAVRRDRLGAPSSYPDRCRSKQLDQADHHRRDQAGDQDRHRDDPASSARCS